MINRVCLVGRLTKDPELQTTTTGKSLCNFSIAVNKRIKPTDGSPDADFFRCTAWGQTADFVTNYLSKGRLIAVDGRLQARRYTTSDGQNREIVEVVAESVQGLDRPKDDGGGATAPNPKAAGPMPDEYDPFQDE